MACSWDDFNREFKPSNTGTLHLEKRRGWIYTYTHIAKREHTSPWDSRHAEYKEAYAFTELGQTSQDLSTLNHPCSPSGQIPVAFSFFKLSERPFKASYDSRLSSAALPFPVLPSGGQNRWNLAADLVGKRGRKSTSERRGYPSYPQRCEIAPIGTLACLRVGQMYSQSQHHQQNCYRNSAVHTLGWPACSPCSRSASNLCYIS